MFEGYITFGYNDSGFGDYTYGQVVWLEVRDANTGTPEEALAALSLAAHEYYEKLQVEEGYEMPYPWTWGDLVNELDLDWLASDKGIVLRSCEACRPIFPHDEIVVSG